MINDYCGGVEDGLAQLVYFGFLKEGDGQCFRVNSAIEGGSFILVAGTIVLAVLNTYVMGAVSQTFRDEATGRRESRLSEVSKRTNRFVC